jgi:type VI secretion system secreted protein VgrG
MPATLGNRASFTFTVEGCDEELRVVRFDGREAISSLFEFRLEIAASDELELEKLVGKPAHLTIEGLAGERQVHGFVCQAEYVGDSRRYALYELTLVPWIWRLQQRSNSRIYQGKTTPEILELVLKASGLPRKQLRLELHGAFAPRDYCTQYGETDLDFISRLMEAEGIIYFFEHEEDAHVLVLTNSGDCRPPPDGPVELTWGPPEGIVHPGEHLTRLRLSELMRPTRVSLRDMNLHQPDLALETSAGGDGEREVYEYPGSYQDRQWGEKQAKLRLEALQATRRRGFGTSDSPRLVPGFTFKLTGHPRDGVDGEYRLLAVTHRGEQPQVLDEDAAGEFHYSNELECMGSKLPYRAPRITPRPTVRGVQTATVVGPEDVHVDEHGRVQVMFHWDRKEPSADGIGRWSCWIRVSQAWAGAAYGAMFLPRVGHEVIVDFIEGDPDRPLITGRIHTGFNGPPYPLPDQKTKSSIKSETTPGGGGSNELRFEDAKGSEELYLHAQRDMNVLVENDKGQTIKHDHTLEVGHDESYTIQNDHTLAVNHDQTATIRGNQSLTVGGDRTIDVGKAHTESIGADMKLDVRGNLNETVLQGKTVRVTQNMTETAGQNIVLQAGKNLNVSTGTNVNISSSGSTRVVAGSSMSLSCGPTTITIDSNGVSIQTSGTVTVKGAAIKLN